MAPAADDKSRCWIQGRSQECQECGGGGHKSETRGLGVTLIRPPAGPGQALIDGQGVNPPPPNLKKLVKYVKCN